MLEVEPDEWLVEVPMGKSIGASSLLDERIDARSMRLRSSRMLPGKS